MQSGSLLNPWGRGFQNTQFLGEMLNKNDADEKEIIKTLAELPVGKLLEFQEQLGDVSSGSVTLLRDLRSFFRLS